MARSNRPRGRKAQQPGDDEADVGLNLELLVLPGLQPSTLPAMRKEAAGYSKAEGQRQPWMLAINTRRQCLLWLEAPCKPQELLVGAAWPEQMVPPRPLQLGWGVPEGMHWAAARRWPS